MSEGKDAKSMLNGLAHIILTVRNVRASAPFYRGLCGKLGLSKVYDSTDRGEYGDPMVYHVGGATAIGIQQPAADGEAVPFDQVLCTTHTLFVLLLIC